MWIFAWSGADAKETDVHIPKVSPVKLTEAGPDSTKCPTMIRTEEFIVIAETDVNVAGGGPAGIGLALSAARNSTETILST